MTAITRAAMVQRVRYELEDFPWETTGTLTNAADTTCAVPDGTDWAEQDRGEFVEDGDIIFVTGISSNDLTVVRGYHGSTAAGHSGTRLLKNPRYHRIEILNAVEQVIQSLPYPRVYKKVADTVTPAPSTTVWYDLAAAALDLISVRQLYGTSDTKQGFYGLNRRFDRRVELHRDMTATLVASGVGLRFPQGFFHSSNTVNVDYAARITDGGTTSYDDLEEGDAITEAVIYGAVAHLEGALENRKPRKPRHDRETLRGAARAEAKYEQLLNVAQMQLRETAPLLVK